MILSNRNVMDKLGREVIIDPLEPKNVNTSSVDVTLGEYYFIEHKPKWWQRLLPTKKIYNIWSAGDIKKVWGEPLKARPAWEVLPGAMMGWRDYPGIYDDDLIILIPPKHTILAHTREFIGGRFNVTTMMKARSSFGRNFIEVCKCAGYGDVGYFNKWTMEITNNSRFYHIPLVVGRRIAQIVFMQTGELASTEEDYSLTGKYQNTGNLEELKKNWAPEMMLPRLDRDRDALRAIIHIV